ncbi:MAG: protein kinase [Alphaproteobacteria bacterium]|nr:protein kinase [Alphaproteobacteria bacterium]
MEPVELRFTREFRAPADVVWRAMSNTDAFNRVAGFGFEFGEEPRPDGSVRRWGRVRRFGQLLQWEERPFVFVAPESFESVRIFESGPLATATARFRIAETASATTLEYTVSLMPRYRIARPVVAADARMTTAGAIRRALDQVVRSVEGDAPDFDPAPALEDWQVASLEAGLEGVDEPVRGALQALVANAPLPVQSRIQPLRLAQQLGIDTEASLAGCLQAVTAGALELRFLVLCPICLGAKEELASLDFTLRPVHCASCNIGYDGALVDNIEVAFRPSDRVRELDVPVDCVQSPSRTPHVLAQKAVGPGESTEVALSLEPGCFRLEAAPVRGALHIEAVPEGPSRVVVDITERGAFPRRVEVGAGEVVFQVRSRVHRECTVSVAERWRPTHVLSVSAFLASPVASRWAYENLDVVGAARDGFAVVVAVSDPWDRGVAKRLSAVLADMERLKATNCQVANGRVIGVVEQLAQALRLAERLSGPDRAVAIAGGGLLALEGPAGEVVVGTAVDRALTVLRGIGWGRTAVDPELALAPGFPRTLEQFRGRMEVVEGWGARPALLRFTELAARGHVKHVDEDVEIDERRVGPFELLEHLGQGGMGSVYRARHRDGGQPVVLKVLHEEYARDFKYAAAFYREARLAWAVDHPRVERVLDWGVDTARRVLFLTMVPLHGPTLTKRLKEEGVLDHAAVTDLANGLLDGLAAIHDAGVVHRDLKPDNVICTESGPVVIDFGVALEMDGGRTRVAGTPSYMSPEQSRGRVLDERSDLYQLAVLLCRAGTGRWPFPGKTAVERLTWRDANEVEALPAGLPPVLEAAVLRALRTDPAARFATARAMKAAINPR